MIESDRCGICRFAFPLENQSDASCQRYPPVALPLRAPGGSDEVQVLSFWPTVSKDSVCGEFAAVLRPHALQPRDP